MPGRRTLSVLVVIALLAATGIATWLAYETERDEARSADQAAVRQAAFGVRQNVNFLVAGLRGATALVSEEGTIDEMRFRSFARDVLHGGPFTGLAWSPPVAAADRAAFEQATGLAMTRLGGAGELIPVPEGADRDLLPITLVYPDTRAQRALLGFDLLSDLDRAQAAQVAVLRGEAKLSAPVELARPRQAGTVLLAPVFPTGGSELAGVLSIGLPGAAIASAVRKQLELGEEITITDAGERLAGPAPSDGAAESEVGVLGRQWTISGPPPTEMDLTPAIAYGASGLALTIVAAGLLLLAVRREQEQADRRGDAERRAARESLQVRITEAVEREIEVDGRLANLARTMVPAVGDICVVHEVTAAGEVRRVGVGAPDERTAELIRSLPEPPATSPIRAAITSREPVLYTRVSEDREAQRARARGIAAWPPPERSEPSAEDALRADQISNMIVPLVAHDRVLGTMSLSVLGSTGRPPLTREDLVFAMEVATHAAVALDNARLYEQQRDIAEILQQALLPRSLPHVPGAEVAVRHRAGMVGTEVGGDFYDLFEVGEGWMAVVGDVCGKGPEAAALTALVRHTLRATARQGPEQAVRRVHEAIRSSGEHTYCTLCCAELRRINGGIEARIATAGHPEPRIVEADGTVHRLSVTGPLVGVLERPSFRAQRVELGSGSLLFICSDGVPEARRRGEVFGDHRLEALLSALSGSGPEAMLERLEQEVVQFVEGRPRDDLALFALRVD